MSNVMLVNVTHVEESRVAILEDGVLAAYEIETINRTNVKGNIYNAVVDSVHPTLEAAFVKLAPELNGFLPLDEVNFKLLPARSDSRKAGRIGQHLHPGQKIMAQVVREPFSGKPPTVSTYFSLPGRYLVLMPGDDSSGISRKIEDSAQRDRLKKILEELRPPEGFGLIARTAGVGQSKAELQRDLRYLLRLWESIQRGSKENEFPGLVYREADLVIRTIRDFLTRDIGEVWIDSQETFEKARAFARDVMPNRARILKLYTGDRPLFNKFNLEEQIERIYKRRVPLPSGGEIVIDGTEALTAIDVNSARSKRQGDIEESTTQTNLEAAAETARQLRLRDLGGLVVVDFIDMQNVRNKKKVERAMREAMRGDPAKYDVTGISKLGLMEIARQRIKGAKMAASYATCPHCDGYGLIKNVETAALAALRKLQTRSTRSGVGRIVVSLPPEVAGWLLNKKREELLRIERRQAVRLEIVAKPDLLRHESHFEAVAREPGEAVPEAIAADERVGRATAAVAPTSRPEPTGAAESKTAPRPSETGGETESDDSRPGEPADAADAPTGDRAAPAEGADGRGRRRRRRRKKARPADAAPAQQSGEGAKPASDAPRLQAVAGDQEADRGDTVPRGVRADELLPAASGSGQKRAGAKTRGSSVKRRRRGTPSRRGNRASG